MDVKALFLLLSKTATRGCAAAGIGFVLGSVGFAIHTLVFLHSSIATTDTVVSLAPVRDENNNLNYTPIFTFHAADGRTYTISSNTASNPAAFAIGEKIRVLYEVNDPTGARIDDLWQLWFIPVCFGIIGLSAGLAGYVLPRIERRRSARTLLSSQGTVAAT